MSATQSAADLVLEAKLSDEWFWGNHNLSWKDWLRDQQERGRLIPRHLTALLK